MNAYVRFRLALTEDEPTIKPYNQAGWANLPDATSADVEILSSEMGMSRIQMYRKTRALTDQTVNEFIQTMRLKRAANLLKMRGGNVAEIAYSVGFDNPSYFAKCFRVLYGKSPSEYRKG